MRFPLPGSLALVLGLAIGGAARAQGEPRALPPLPAPAGESPPATPPPPPPPPPNPPPPPPGSLEPDEGSGPPGQYEYVTPAPGAPAMSRADYVHAPRYALWLGARLGVLAYGGGVYQDPNGYYETTGNFITNGVALEMDVGVRIERRYIPYGVFELGLVGAGHRFEQTSTTAGTSFVGVGLRLLAGNVDNVSFASELSFGLRKMQVSNSTGTWSATGFEFLRLGLGAEIRLANRFTLSPTMTISGGTLTDTSGSIGFGPNQGDGLSGTPDYVNHGQIPSGLQTPYAAFVVGCGAHFDLFGK